MSRKDYVRIGNNLYNSLPKGTFNNEKYIAVIDFSIAAIEERLFLIDRKIAKVIKQIKVSHGVNSGRLGAVPESFSNTLGSHQSSLGVYATGHTYHGAHGYSLKLHGLERTNDLAYRRAIVMHGADYVAWGGRSFGCPAIEHKHVHEVINKLKNGAMLAIIK
jgi:hypothetical protein